jgi:trehalose-phosphatase
MKTLVGSFDFQKFISNLAQAEKSALILDYDGTLAPFRKERDLAVPYGGVPTRLAQIMDSDKTRLIIVSGRRVKDIKALLPLDTLPEIWGCHGGERLDTSGKYRLATLPRTVLTGLTQVDAWVVQNDLQSRCERKPISVAFHWRGLPPQEAEALKEQIEQQFAGSAAESGLALHAFDGGLELRAASITKAHAVRMIVSETAIDAPVAYLGDDATDEDAFEALGSRGLKVLVREELRPTRADLWLVPPRDLISFLDNWIDAAR